MLLLFTIFTVVYLLFVLFDLVPIFKSKKYKEFWIYTIVLAGAYVTQVLFIFGVKIPSINIWIYEIFKSI